MTDLLSDILAYHPEEDPTTLLSRAYNRIEELERLCDDLRSGVATPTEHKLRTAAERAVTSFRSRLHEALELVEPGSLRDATREAINDAVR